MKVIVISGKAGAGKDTVAEILATKLEALDKSVLITHYADLVKFMCKSYFGWDGKKDEYGRGLLQYVGTDIVRKQNPNYWVDYVISVIALFRDEWDFVIIPDCRFQNEIDRLKEVGLDVVHIRVERPGLSSSLIKEQQQHVSETALDHVDPDYTIMNVGCLELLYESIEVTVGE